MADSCTVQQSSHHFLIKSIKSSEENSDPKAVLDTSYETAWNGTKKGSFLVLEPDYSDPDANGKGVNQLRIAFGDGREKQSTFVVQETSDNLHFTNLTEGLKSSGRTDGLELFNFSKESKAPFIRVVVEDDQDIIHTIQLVNDPSWKPNENIPVPDPTAPENVDLGRVKDWGSKDKDPNNWKVVNMKNNNKLFKVIDKDGVNVADLFQTQKGAQAFIDKKKGGQTPPPPPPVDPNAPQPQGESYTTSDGVTFPIPKGFKVTKELHNPNNNDRDDGQRKDFNGLGESFKHCIYIAYTALTAPVKDEKSFKMRGGKHSKGSRPKTFDIGIDLISGQIRYRTEDKHPEYSGGKVGEGKCLPQGDKFIGTAGVIYNINNDSEIVLQVWEDAGDSETKPANEWKLKQSWNITDPLWVIPPVDHAETLRIDDPKKKGLKEAKYKYLTLLELTPI